MSTSYDYIILGAGAAGLSLAIRLHDEGFLENKRLLLIDRDAKNRNDRTWCFWEKEKGYFESLVHHQWDHLQFIDTQGIVTIAMEGYRYKMIRGADFYQFAKETLRAHSSVTWLTGHISLEKDAITHTTTLYIDGEVLDTTGALVFNTLYIPPTKKEAPLQLLQHFKGWFIETEEACFDPTTARFMDFNVSQEHGATFVYTLPFSKHAALVEYTLFSPTVLPEESYDDALRDYITSHLGIQSYTIQEVEFGIIPMNNKKYSFYQDGMFHLGMAGGQTKASTGFTFQNIQRRCDAIIAMLQSGVDLKKTPKKSSRFHFYDSVLLDLLCRNILEGRAIFAAMFRKNKGTKIFKFLDEKTTLIEEISIFKTLQIPAFIKAALRVLFQ